MDDFRKYATKHLGMNKLHEPFAAQKFEYFEKW